MVTEDYVSFEVAKLLKEKGAEFATDCFYSPEGRALIMLDDRDYKELGYTQRPSYSMAMKWLREVHHIFICILPYEVGPGVMDYTYVLYKIEATDFLFKDIGIQGRANTNNISYEETCEAAIKYCLDNLI